MNTEFFKKEITLEMPITKVVGSILEITKIKEFTLLSENKVLNKIILEFQSIYRIEILLEWITEERTKVNISVLDKNDSYYKVSDIASNISLNFENALTAFINGNIDEFTVQSFKVDGVQGCLQLLMLGVAVFGIGYAVYSFFS